MGCLEHLHGARVVELVNIRSIKDALEQGGRAFFACVLQYVVAPVVHATRQEPHGSQLQVVELGSAVQWKSGPFLAAQPPNRPGHDGVVDG